jgi:hypothetical protein
MTIANAASTPMGTPTPERTMAFKSNVAAAAMRIVVDG